MKRLRAAICIFLAACVLCAGSSLAVRRVTAGTQQRLAQVRAAALQGDYALAAEDIDALVRYFTARQPLLECFLRRDSVAAAAVNLAGLRAYAGEANLQDLLTELDKAAMQVEQLRHVYTGLL